MKKHLYHVTFSHTGEPNALTHSHMFYGRPKGLIECVQRIIETRGAMVIVSATKVS